MSTITVICPVAPDDPPPRLDLAARGPLPTRPVIGLVDNRKPHARQLLQLLADEIQKRVGPAEVVLLEKRGAGNPMLQEQASDMAARAHIVITGVGD